MYKILIFTDTFLPGYRGGGPITSVANLVALIDDSFEILICTSNHDFGESEPYQDILSDEVISYKKYNVIYLSAMNTKSIEKVIKEFNPDLLYLNSFFSKVTQIVMLLNKSVFKKPSIIAPRGELQKNALSIKPLKKKIYLSLYKFFNIGKNIVFHATDKIESEAVEKLFAKKSNLLFNVVAVEHFTPLTKEVNTLKLLFVSRISRKKNLLYALEILKSVNVRLSFDIYGPIEDLEYWKECQRIIKELPQNISVSYKGALPQAQIVTIMREYHALFFPTLSENFGHVIVEAMQAGLIPIISDQTPWRDLELYNAGWDIALDEKRKYKNVIETLFAMDNEAYSKKSLAIIEYIHKKLDMQKIKREYIDFFQKVIEKVDDV